MSAREDTAGRCGAARGRQEAVDGLRAILLNEEFAPQAIEGATKRLAESIETP